MSSDKWVIKAVKESGHIWSKGCPDLESCVKEFEEKFGKVCENEDAEKVKFFKLEEQFEFDIEELREKFESILESDEEYEDEGLEFLSKNNDYLEEHYEELKEEYGGKFVGVSSIEEEIIEGDTASEVLEKIRERSMDVEKFLVEYIPKKEDLENV